MGAQGVSVDECREEVSWSHSYNRMCMAAATRNTALLEEKTLLLVNDRYHHGRLHNQTQTTVEEHQLSTPANLQLTSAETKSPTLPWEAGGMGPGYTSSFFFCLRVAPGTEQANLNIERADHSCSDGRGYGNAQHQTGVQQLKTTLRRHCNVNARTFSTHDCTSTKEVSAKRRYPSVPRNQTPAT